MLTFEPSSFGPFFKSTLGEINITIYTTTMEGSFGTQKEHYSLKRVKARKKVTEIMYIFFGIHAANVVQLAARIAEQQEKAEPEMAVA